MSEEIQELRADALELVSGGMNVNVDSVNSTVAKSGDASLLSSAVLGQIVQAVVSQIQNRGRG